MNLMAKANKAMFLVGSIFVTASLSSCTLTRREVSAPSSRWVYSDSIHFDFQGIEPSDGAGEFSEGGKTYFYYVILWSRLLTMNFDVFSKETREYVGTAWCRFSDEKYYQDEAYQASILLEGKNETGLSYLDLDGKILYRYPFPDSERDAKFTSTVHWSSQGAEFYTQRCKIADEGDIHGSDDYLALPLDHYLGKLDYLGTKIVFRMAFLDGGRYEALRYDGKDGEILFSGSYSTTKGAMEATVESSSLPSFPYGSFHFVPDVNSL